MKKINIPIKHLTSMTFFCGTGGSSAGAKMAGFSEIFASDWGKLQEKSFKQNFPEVPFHREDITKLSFESIREKIKQMSKGKRIIRRRMLDFMSFSSPCQGFCRANTKRRPFDKRNLLFLECIRLVADFQPKVALIENVPGMFDREMKPMFCKILSELDNLKEYYYSYKVLNCMDYGAVPQNRDRAIFLIVRKDVGLPTFPKPVPVKMKQVALNTLFPYLDHFSPGQFHDKLVSARKPINTLTASGSEWVYQNGQRRKLNIDELKRLATMDDFNFKGFTPNQVRLLVGNAVMPRFMGSLSNHIKMNILRKK